MKAYEQGILLREQHINPAIDIANDYIETVDSNIRLFLKDKSNKMDISVETIHSDFTDFWSRIGAEGDLDKALNEWQTNYNAS